MVGSGVGGGIDFSGQMVILSIIAHETIIAHKKCCVFLDDLKTFAYFMISEV